MAAGREVTRRSTAIVDEGSGIVMNEPEGIGPLPTVPTLGKQVYTTLEGLLLDGALKPGQRLVETELAQKLGVSRGPVREALQMMHRDGWVDIRPRQGAFVHEPDEKEIDDFFSVRRVLEMECARLAALNARPRDHERLNDLLQRGTASLRTGTDADFIDANHQFHSELTRIADNRVLGELVERLSKRTRWYFAPLLIARRIRAWEEHEVLVRAIEQQDAQAAMDVMAEHVDATRRAYIEHQAEHVE